MAEETPRNTPELLAQIDAEWQALHAAIAGLTPAQMTAPGAGGWSIKDNLAHIAEWEQYLLRLLLGSDRRAAFVGVPPALIEGDDVNPVNDILFKRNRDRDLNDVLAGLRRSHEQVMAKIEATPFEDLLKPIFPDLPDTVLEWVAGNTYDHYREHRETIELIAD